MIGNWIVYLWILVFVFAVVLTFGGVLRWIADKDENKRKKKLTIISVCAFFILLVMLLNGNWEKISDVLENVEGSNFATYSLVNISKITMKILLIVLIVAFSLIIAFLAGLLVIYSVRAISRTISEFEKDNRKELKSQLQIETEKIIMLMKTPVFITGIVGGIVALYLVLPLFMGEPSGSLAESWTDGVGKIVQFCTDESSNKLDDESANKSDDESSNKLDDESANKSDDESSDKLDDESGNKSNNEFATNLSVYSLIFVLIVGIGYGVVNILFEIIRERFKNNTVFLKEYSNSIGLLAVGVSVLLLISQLPPDFNKESWGEIVLECSRPFVIVIFVIALGILILEIVRLLIDMREKMIRHEARYIFVFLVGLCTVIIMKTFLIVYRSISSILGGKDVQSDVIEEKIQNICNQILEKVGEDMKEEIETNMKEDGEVPYSIFKGEITKK